MRGWGVRGRDADERRSSPDSLELTALLARYLEHLEKRGCSVQTRASRRYALTRWFSFLARQRVRTVNHLRGEHVSAFGAWLAHQRARRGHRRGRLLAEVTREGWMGSIRTFCTWLVRADVVLVNPALGVTWPRAARSLPRVLTLAEVDQIFAAMTRRDPLELRDRALLEVLYSSGLRASEVLGLNLADVDLAAGEVLIRRAKGGGQRRVPLGEPAVRALETYLARGRDALRWPLSRRRPDPEALFLTRFGTRAIRVSLAQMVRRRAREAGVAGRVTAHTWRHTAAVHLLKGGADIRQVQEFLGHASAETTTHYTRLTVEDLKSTLARCHPRERRRRNRCRRR